MILSSVVLPGSRRTQQGQQFALFHRQIDIVERW